MRPKIKDMELSPSKRALLSLGALAVGYLAGLLVWSFFDVAHFLFRLNWRFHAIASGVVTVLGWLVFTLPFLVIGPTRSFFDQDPLRSAVIGGAAGFCIVETFLLILLRPSVLGLRDYPPVLFGYGVCAFVIGFIATGLYVMMVGRRGEHAP
jgi:hypothetical protein